MCFFLCELYYVFFVFFVVLFDLLHLVRLLNSFVVVLMN